MIICAAIKFAIEATGKEVILCGCRHGDIFAQLEPLGFEPHKGYKWLEQGFIDQDNKFYTRAEAFTHAKECGQIKTDKERGTIYSEDIYPPTGYTNYRYR